jgi:peptide chain release factor subunit 3
LQALLHSVDKKTGKRTKAAPNFVKQGQAVIARLETDGLICVERYEDYQQLGRFTLRDEGKTVAMGKVLKLIEAADPAPAAAAAAVAAAAAATLAAGSSSATGAGSAVSG